MIDIMNVIAILQAVRNVMASTPHYTSSEPFCFAEEIRQLTEAIAMLSPPEDESAEEPEQPPNTPPVFGPWLSCEHGIDAKNGDWIFLAWWGRESWQYYCVQVNCDEHIFELLEPDGDKIEWEPKDFYMRTEQ